MKKLNARKILVLLLAAALVGCTVPPAAGPTPSSTKGSGSVQPVTLRSDKPRVEDPQADQADVAALAQGNAAFAFDLYHQLAGKDGNLFYSPYSISMALAMVEAGARGETKTEIDQALHFSLSQERLHPAFNALDQAIKQRAADIPESSDKPFQLNIANAAWTQKEYPILPAYLDLLAQQYGAGVAQVDFEQNTEAARQAINQWVEDQTADKIKNLVPDGALDPLTRMVLVNAIYFNASWLEPFNKKNTRDQSFTQMDGSQVTVPMMHRSSSMGYAKGDGYQLVELPYISPNLVMDVIVPDAGRLAEVEKTLSGEVVAGMLKDINYTQVNLGLPRFKYEAETALSQQLKAMGMKLAFTPGAADLTGISSQNDLYIQDVLHKAYVSVDENGTEAAAATAVMVGTTSMPSEPVELTVDRTFIFLIRDRENGAVLFVGRVASIQP